MPRLTVAILVAAADLLVSASPARADWVDPDRVDVKVDDGRTITGRLKIIKERRKVVRSEPRPAPPRAPRERVGTKPRPPARQPRSPRSLTPAEQDGLRTIIDLDRMRRDFYRVYPPTTGAIIGQDLLVPSPARPRPPAPIQPGPGPAPGAEPAPAPVITQVMIEEAVEVGVTRLDLPLPTPHVGPDPARNEWGATAVGFPLWLWTDDQQPLTASVTVGPVTLTMTATPGPILLDLGDGTRLTCATSTPYPADAKPGAVSPTCGHRYADPGRYTITATQTWQVAWEAAGQQGTLDVARTASTSVTVMELESVVVR